MVTAGWPGWRAAVRGAMSALGRDVAACMPALTGRRAACDEPPRGLMTYRFGDTERPLRLHLRIQPDETGLLFRDINDVMHLSSTAAHMVWLALERTPEHQAVRRLVRRYPGVKRSLLLAHYRSMVRLAQTVADPACGCPACELALARTAPFSTPVQAPHKADLALTYACNNRCPHCYNPPDRFEQQSLDTEQWRRVLDRLAGLGVPHVIFTGGEPTLHPGLAELVAHAEGLGQIAGLVTNGRRLAEPGYLEHLRRAGLDHVQITIGSHRPQVHDAMVGWPAAGRGQARATAPPRSPFEQTLAGIRAALQSPLHTLTNTTLTRCNVDHAEQLVSFLHALGVRTFAMNGLLQAGGGRGNPDALAPETLAPALLQIRDAAQRRGMRFLWYTVTPHCELSPLELDLGARRCNAAQYSMCIEPNGDVTPCQSYYAVAGNLLRDDWEQIWRGRLFRSFRLQQQPQAAGLPRRCHDCADLAVCGGGCRLARDAARSRCSPPGQRPAIGAGGMRSSGAPAMLPARPRAASGGAPC